MFLTFIKFLSLATLLGSVRGQTAYANDFVDPDYILANNFGPHTYAARNKIISWAESNAASGPWSVMNKSVTPPSGTKHDYMSWAPYWWPDCSKVGNTTALSDEDVWKTCPYVSRDGQFNPDVRFVNDVGAFGDMSEAVFYNSLAWVISNDTTKKTTYEDNVARFIRAWFLDADTRMDPNLNFGQMQRGPDGQTGTHTGVLDLKSFAKITSAILILRKGKSTAWTTDLDNGMISWSKEYITWLETAGIAVEEGLADNNHGTFYYNQLAALKILVNDLPGAKNVTNTYFDKQYMSQIIASGEQPLEASRTRPYHYRAYNLAAMITNARIEKYVDPSSDPFHKPTSAGSNIKSALDFAMTFNAADSGEASYAVELHPNVAAVAAVYGDSDGKYLKYLKQADPVFVTQPYIVWNQPFAASETAGLAPAVKASSKTPSKSSSSSSSSSTQDNKTSDAVGQVVHSWLVLALAPIALGFGLVV